jgi:pimeloyl-ACP methyl ester carboxylesterase
MRTVEHFVPNHAGWHLSLFQTWSPEKLDRSRRPVMIVPGYGMNSFIFSYHPNGPSLEGYLAQAGFEVWRVDLRAQGRSVSVGGGEDYGLEDLAITDLGVAIRGALERTRTDGDRLDVIGASLGGTILFIHAVLNEKHRLGSLVAMGSPVRWVKIHPAIKLAFSSPLLVGLVRFRGTRKIAEVALPEIVRRTPWLLSIYMNSDITDMSAAREMVRTVEDPNRHVNREIAQWIRDKDLILKGVNIAEGLTRVQNPLLCVLAGGDGIVPRETAEFPYLKVASQSKKLLEVGLGDRAMGHADLFISNDSQLHVFEPIAAWLKEQ